MPYDELLIDFRRLAPEGGGVLINASAYGGEVPAPFAAPYTGDDLQGLLEAVGLCGRSSGPTGRSDPKTPASNQ